MVGFNSNFEVPISRSPDDKMPNLLRLLGSVVLAASVSGKIYSGELEIPQIEPNYPSPDLLLKEYDNYYYKPKPTRPIGSVSENPMRRILKNYDFTGLLPPKIGATDSTLADVKPDKAIQVAAHRYRSARLRSEAFSDFWSALSATHAAAELPEVIRAARVVRSNTASPGEQHRALAPFLAAILTDPERRPAFMAALDAAATETSAALRREAADNGGKLSADVVIVGAGIQGTAMAAELRAQMPGARIIMVDSSDKLGGQFRSYGSKPVFYINSRNHRPEDIAAAALPGSSGNLNTLGRHAPLQVTDYSFETYPTNVDLGVAAAANAFLSAEPFLEADLELVEESGQNFMVTIQDQQDGSQKRIKAKQVVIASGLGKRESVLESNGSTVLTAEEFLSIFGDADNNLPMQRFKDKTIAIVGGGDTGRVCAELLTRLGPPEAYGRSSVQMGGPKQILWFGVDFADRKEFCAKNRSRYQRLQPFISSEATSNSEAGLSIVPVPEKVESVRELDKEVQIVIANQTRYNGSMVFYADIVIDTTQLTNRDTIEKLSTKLGNPLDVLDIIKVNGRSEAATVARQFAGGVFLVGPAGSAPLTRAELATYPSGIKENTASIWANTTRTVAVAEMIARKLRTVSPTDY
ncbi:MAG TPA: FAD-dependent oxidoreductase [Candidatus Saccharimonadales bacterium]|nr:FAD-dependent oxidoreductase [Candidatus Saccharimonadales bacterium]